LPAGLPAQPRAVATPPFTGGLFLGNDAVESFTQDAFVIDHDQPLSMHGVVNWTHPRGWYATVSNRYDYGLVCNPSDLRPRWPRIPTFSTCSPT